MHHNFGSVAGVVPLNTFSLKILLVNEEIIKSLV